MVLELQNQINSGMLLNCYTGNFRYTNAQKLLTGSKYGAHDKHIKGDKER